MGGWAGGCTQWWVPLVLFCVFPAPEPAGVGESVVAFRGGGCGWNDFILFFFPSFVSLGLGCGHKFPGRDDRPGEGTTLEPGLAALAGLALAGMPPVPGCWVRQIFWAGCLAPFRGVTSP